MNLEKLLGYFSGKKASDLHAAVGSPPLLRTLHGMEEAGKGNLTSEDMSSIVEGLLVNSDRNRRQLEENGACQFSYQFSDSVFRITIFRSSNGYGLAIRELPSELPSLEEMEVPEQFIQAVEKDRGLVLITGPAASGKTSTLHGIVEYLNRNYYKNIITIEDPVEYFHRHAKSIIHQREVGRDVPTPESGVKQALEQDPDVLVVGEITGYEVIDGVLKGAEAGHLILATLNTSGTAHALNWLLDAAPADLKDQLRYRLAGSLKAVLSQVLLPPAKGKGSVPAYELMLMNQTISSLIRKNKIARIINVMHSEGGSGMKLLDDSLYDLYTAKRIKKEDMLNAAVETVEIETRLTELKAREEQQRAFQ